MNIFFLLLTACAPDSIIALGSCPDVSDDAPLIEYTELTPDVAGVPLAGDIVTVITSDTELAAFEDDNGFGFEETVDLSTRQILVANLSANVGCSASGPDLEVIEADGQIVLDYEVNNGACDVACEQAFDSFVAVAVDANVEGAVCARLVNPCE